MGRSVRVLSSKGWENRRRASKPRRDGYEKRNRILRDLGYKSYSEYLKSDEWIELRNERMRDCSCCVVCSRPATEVHHFSYETTIILGVHKDLLLPLCRKCHEDTELDVHRKKRTLRESKATLLDNLTIRGKHELVEKIRIAVEIAEKESRLGEWAKFLKTKPRSLKARRVRKHRSQTNAENR